MTTTNLPESPIVLVDDEQDALLGMKMTLLTAQISNIVCCESGKEALEVVASRGADLVILDLIMPHVSGEYVFGELRKRRPDIPVIMATGVNDVDTAVRCIKRGAHDYITKPIETERFIRAVQNALTVRGLEKENARLKAGVLSDGVQNPDVFGEIVTGSPKMTALFRYIEAVAETPHPILITGESGVGKELIARAIHRASGRSGKLLAVNVAGLDEEIFADTLFGHVKGAFTGADVRRQGLIERAAHGTLFLDEIGDLSNASQVKLLRVIQEKEYFPIGRDVPSTAHVRLITATCKEPEQLRSSDAFRRDLFYRLNTHHIHVPPLRERREDIQPLSEYFFDTAAKELRLPTPVAPNGIYSMFASHPFAGNVRELQSLIYDAVSAHRGGEISSEFIKDRLEQGAKDVSNEKLEDGTCVFRCLDMLPTLKDAHTALIDEALRRTGGVLSSAARILGITPQALGQRIRRRVES